MAMPASMSCSWMNRIISFGDVVVDAVPAGSEAEVDERAAS